MSTPDPESAETRLKTGISGLDEILLGGFPSHRLYLVEGQPGTGKTTLALQFLLEGKRLGERVLYVTLSETKEELGEVARSHGWSLEGIDVYELEAAESRLKPEQDYTVFLAEEVELTETVRHVYEEVERITPTRVVFDSLSEMRLLAKDALRYRRQILNLKQFFNGRGCTVLLLDDMAAPDAQLRSISHGVLSLERTAQDYGAARRRLDVVKLRGSQFRDGYHDYRIATGGLRVFPRLVAAEHRAAHDRSVLQSGIAELDLLLGRGLCRGTSTLIMGSAGTGKSTLAGSYLAAVARQGKCGIGYLFEEDRQTLIDRMAGLSMDIQGALDAGLVTLRQLDPAELSPGEFAHLIRNDVESRGVEVVVIDSLNGYLNSMPNDRFLLVQLHEMLSYLAGKGVVTIMILAQQGTVGQTQASIEASYLADTVLLLRFFESSGAIKKAVSVIKHRKSAHEETIRELRLTPEGIRIGEVLRNFRGILTGFPEYLGSAGDLVDPSK
jgi:circadian clock protein KaiC